MPIKNVTLPTWLTIARIALVPFIIKAIIFKQWTHATLLFCVAIMTDFFDGFLARRWKQETALGAALDPVADKFLLLSCFSSFVFFHAPVVIPNWFFGVLLIKELLLIVGFIYLRFFINKLYIAKPTMLGKVAGCAHFLFIFLILLSPLYNFNISSLWLWPLLILSLLALVQYMYNGYNVLTQ